MHKAQLLDSSANITASPDTTPPKKKRSIPPAEQLSWTIAQWCTLNNISRATFYRAPPDDRPRLTQICGVDRITREADAEYKAARVHAADTAA